MATHRPRQAGARVLEPLAGGELGPDTVLDRSTHPPGLNRAQFVLDTPTTADLMESYPVYLVSEELAALLDAASLSGFHFDDAEVFPGENYLEDFGDAPHKQYRWLRPEPDVPDADVWITADFRLGVSARMWHTLQQADLRGCDVEPL
jgi:hypothetical protein